MAMNASTFLAACLSVVTLMASSATADLVLFRLDGKAGLGLLPGNENHTVTDGGTGGIFGGDIVLNTDTNELTINVAWGSGNGFTDLSGDATAMHIHGPVDDPSPAGWFQNAGVLVTLNTLAGFNASASQGGLTGTVTLSDLNETRVLGGFTYLNVHTALNPGGEIRGHLSAVPEPSVISLGLIASLTGLGCGGWRRFRRRAAPQSTELGV